jgi:hypothetical protein
MYEAFSKQCLFRKKSGWDQREEALNACEDKDRRKHARRITRSIQYGGAEVTKSKDRVVTDLI